jgi:hypothetical protein
LALPDSANLSASSRFLGACCAIAAFTAAMNAALSKLPGCAAFIFSALAALPWATLSSWGGRLAAWPLAASPAGGGCADNSFWRPRTSPVSAANFGSDSGPGRAPSAGAGAGACAGGWARRWTGIGRARACGVGGRRFASRPATARFPADAWRRWATALVIGRSRGGTAAAPGASGSRSGAWGRGGASGRAPALSSAEAFNPGHSARSLAWMPRSYS